jgi:molybdopterin synthase catalytic subunit
MTQFKQNHMSEYLFKGPVTPEIISATISKLGSRSDTGGHSVFLGQVRADTVDDRTVAGIEYSAYDRMVNDEAGKILNEISGTYNDVMAMEIIHSTGFVRAGEISLMVIVSAGHRDHAILACRQLVELVKQRLPVWKKEIFEDESHRWKGNS